MQEKRNKKKSKKKAKKRPVAKPVNPNLTITAKVKPRKTTLDTAP